MPSERPTLMTPSHNPVRRPCFEAAARNSRAATVSLGNAQAQDEEPLAVTAEGIGWRYAEGAGGGVGRMRTLERGGVVEEKDVLCLLNRDVVLRGDDRDADGLDFDVDAGVKNADDADDADDVVVAAEDDADACRGSKRHNTDSG